MIKRPSSLLVIVSGFVTITLFLVWGASHPGLVLIFVLLLSAAELTLVFSARAFVEYFTAFILAPLIFDIPAVHLGVWSFATPQFFGIPFWLPFVYGNVALCVMEFRRFFYKKHKL